MVKASTGKPAQAKCDNASFIPLAARVQKGRQREDKLHEQVTGGGYSNTGRSRTFMDVISDSSLMDTVPSRSLSTLSSTRVQ